LLNYTHVRRQLLKTFICFLALTALIAIASVLTGEFGEIQAKILGTSFTISAASICSMACAAFIEKKKLARLGLSGIGMSVVAAILVIIGMWAEIDAEFYLKTMATCIVGAVASAHACLLVLPSLQQRHRWIQTTSVGSIAVLSLLILIALWAEIDANAYFRLLAVVAILVGLETLVIPLLLKLGGKQASGESTTQLPMSPPPLPSPGSAADTAQQTLELRPLANDIYVDTWGRRYRVLPLDDDPNGRPVGTDNGTH